MLLLVAGMVEPVLLGKIERKKRRISIVLTEELVHVYVCLYIYIYIYIYIQDLQLIVNQNIKDNVIGRLHV